MSTANTRTETLPDIDPDTFVRFCEFAYTGDYTPPMWQTVDARSDTVLKEPAGHDEPEPAYEAVCVPENEQPKLPEDDWSWDFRASKKKAKRGKISREAQVPNPRQTDLLTGDTYYPSIRREEFDIECTPRGNDSASQDFTSVFLGHAKVYVLAERYDISQLSDLALHKLNATLKQFQLFEERVEDLMQLARFTYSNTYNYESRVDRLQKLVVRFIASYQGALVRNQSFHALLGEGGQFVIDLFPLISHRL